MWVRFLEVKEFFNLYWRQKKLRWFDRYYDFLTIINKDVFDKVSDTEKKRILLMGKRSKQGIEFLHRLFKKPVVTIKDVQAMSGLSPKAANDLVRAFVDQKILVETTGYQRNRVFVFNEYVRMF